MSIQDKGMASKWFNCIVLCHYINPCQIIYGGIYEVQ